MRVTGAVRLAGWIVACVGTLGGCATTGSHGAKAAANAGSGDPEAATRLVDAGPDDLVGTAHPVTFQGADPDGRWVAICQARADTNGNGTIEVRGGMHGEVWGDAMRMYLVPGHGPGEPIDELLAASPSGRWVALRKGEQVLLVDHELGTRTALPVGSTSALPERVAAFGADERDLLYARADAGRVVLVRRELASGEERALDPGAGLLFHFELLEGSSFALAYVIDRDTDGDGEVSVPTLLTSRADEGCGSPSSYSTMGLRGDQPTQRLLPLDGGTPPALTGKLIVALGNSWITEVNDVATLHRPDGSSAVLAPAGSCEDGWFLHGNPEREAIVAACKQPDAEYAWQIQIFTPAGRRTLDTPIHGGSTDEHPINAGYIVEYIKQRGGGGWLDLRTEDMHPEDQLIWRRDGTLLVHRAGALQIVDSETKESWSLLATDKPYGVSAQGSSLVYSQPWIIDIANKTIVGRWKGTVVGLRRDGAVLVLPEATARAGKPTWSLPTGPLRWARPQRVQSAAPRAR